MENCTVCSNENRIEVLEDTVKELKLENKELKKELLEKTIFQTRIEEVLKNINKSIEDTNTSIKDMQSQIKTLTDKGKFDFLDYFKNKVIPVLLGGGIVLAILKVVGKI